MSSYSNYDEQGTNMVTDEELSNVVKDSIESQACSDTQFESDSKPLKLDAADDLDNVKKSYQDQGDNVNPSNGDNY